MSKNLTHFGYAFVIAGLSGTVAHADITNIATVTGSYGGADVTAEDEVAVAVVEGAPGLTIAKTASEADISFGKDDRADAGDKITYTFVITNNGNVTLRGVTPVDSGPTFGGQAGTGTLSAFEEEVSGDATATLAPTESATFTAVYTLSDLDVYHAADTAELLAGEKALAANVATASGVDPSDEAYADPDESEAKVEIAPFPEVDLVKLADLDDTNENGFADEGETITYTYTVTNTGNVPLAGITVADVHEGENLTSGTDITSEALLTEGPLAATTGAVSTDDLTADNGIWGSLQPEAVVVFTYVHVVSQAEVDGG